MLRKIWTRVGSLSLLSLALPSSRWSVWGSWVDSKTLMGRCVTRLKMHRSSNGALLHAGPANPPRINGEVQQGINWGEMDGHVESSNSFTAQVFLRLTSPQSSPFCFRTISTFAVHNHHNIVITLVRSLLVWLPLSFATASSTTLFLAFCLSLEFASHDKSTLQVVPDI